MREIRQSGSEGGARFNPLSLPLSAVAALPRCASCASALNFPRPTIRPRRAAQNHLPAVRQQAILHPNHGLGNQAVTLEAESPRNTAADLLARVARRPGMEVYASSVAPNYHTGSSSSDRKSTRL